MIKLIIAIIVILLPGYQCQSDQCNNTSNCLDDCCGDIYCPTNRLFQYFSVGLKTCTQLTADGNDFVNAFAIAISGSTVFVALLWMIFCCAKNRLDDRMTFLVNDNIFTIVMTGVGVSLALSSCYPQQVTMTAYIVAFGYIIKSYSWTDIRQPWELLNVILDSFAMGFNTFIVWLAAIAITGDKSCQGLSQKDTWGIVGNPFAVMLIGVIWYVITGIICILGVSTRILNIQFITCLPQAIRDDPKLWIIASLTGVVELGLMILSIIQLSEVVRVFKDPANRVDYIGAYEYAFSLMFLGLLGHLISMAILYYLNYRRRLQPPANIQPPPANIQPPTNIQLIQSNCRQFTINFSQKN